MFKILFTLSIFINILFAESFYCPNLSTTCSFDDGSQTELSSSDFTGNYSLLSNPNQTYHLTRGFVYSSCSGCMSRVDFENNNIQFSRQRDIINNALYNCQTACNGNESCNNTCQNSYDNSINQLSTNLQSAIFLQDGSFCNELYYDYNLGGVVNCDPNTGDKTVIPNASLSPTGDLSCADGYYASSLPHMTIGSSGYNWNSQDCVSKIYKEDMEGGGTITTNFDDNGQIESASYVNSEGNVYTIKKDDNGNLIGIVQDSSGNVLETGTIEKNEDGVYQYTSNNSSSNNLTNSTLNDFYNYNPSNTTGGTGSNTGNTGTNTGGTTDNTNNTNLDGLNQDYITPTTGTGGNSQTDVMNDLKNSLDLNTNALLNQNSQNNEISNSLDDLTSALSQSASNSSFDTSSYQDFLNNMGNSFNSIQNTFNDTKNIIDNGFTFDTSKYSSYTDCTMSTTAFGQTISIDFCSAFTPFRTFITFLVTMLLIFHSIKIFMWGLK